MPRICTLKNSRGFTLVETLIATVIVSISFLGMSTLTTTAIRSLSLSNHRMTAATLAQDKLEEIKNDTYTNVTSAKYNTEDYNTIGYNTIAEYLPYRRVVTIAAGPEPNTRIITVAVSWKETVKGSPTVTLSAIMSQ